MVRFEGEGTMRIALAVLVASVAVSAGEKPVPGPPWKTSWPEARKEALAAGKPIFIYFTKTS